MEERPSNYDEERRKRNQEIVRQYMEDLEKNREDIRQRRIKTRYVKRDTGPRLNTFGKIATIIVIALWVLIVAFLTMELG